MGGIIIILILTGAFVLIIITVIDYLWIGRKLIKEAPLKSKDLLVFYFGRNVAELLMFIFGIGLGWTLARGVT